MKLYLWLILLVAIGGMGLIFFVLRIFPTYKVSGKNYCITNDECVAATCCHSNSCVNRNYMPNCTDVVCTLECKPGTMDCGQGYCACIDNKCIAVIR